jgi:hypothetical protein
MMSNSLGPLNLNRQGAKDTKVGTFERSNVPDHLGGLGPLGGKDLGTASDADATATRPQRMTMLRARPSDDTAPGRMTMQRRPA